MVTIHTSLVYDELIKEIQGRGKHLRFKAYGNSMFPLIKNGDSLVIKPENAGSIKIGDIILYRNTWGGYIVHRFIKKKGQAALLTRGDNVPGYDIPVAIENIMGRVVQIENQRRKLTLTGWPNRIFARCIALFSRIIFRGQVRLTRTLGRLWWIIEGRRINQGAVHKVINYAK